MKTDQIFPKSRLRSQHLDFAICQTLLAQICLTCDILYIEKPYRNPNRTTRPARLVESTVDSGLCGRNGSTRINAVIVLRSGYVPLSHSGGYAGYEHAR